MRRENVDGGTYQSIPHTSNDRNRYRMIQYESTVCSRVQWYVDSTLFVIHAAEKTITIKEMRLSEVNEINDRARHQKSRF